MTKHFHTAFKNKLSSNIFVTSNAALLLDRVITQLNLQAGTSSKLIGGALRAKLVEIFEGKNESYFKFLDKIADRLSELPNEYLTEHWDDYDLSLQEPGFVVPTVTLDEVANEDELAVIASLKDTVAPRSLAQLYQVESVLMNPFNFLSAADFNIYSATSEDIGGLFYHLNDLRNLYRKDLNKFNETGMSMSLQ